MSHASPPWKCTVVEAKVEHKVWISNWRTTLLLSLVRYLMHATSSNDSCVTCATYQAFFLHRRIKKCSLEKIEWKLYITKPRIKKIKNFIAPFYGWGSTASRLERLRGGSLLFTTKFTTFFFSSFFFLLLSFYYFLYIFTYRKPNYDLPSSTSVQHIFKLQKHD